MLELLKDKWTHKYKKKGIQSLTLIVGVLIGFIAISALYDLTSLQTKFSTLSAQTGYVSRAVADQGGVSTEPVENYHGRYVTSSELFRNVKSAMNHAGIQDGNWEVRVAGHTLTASTETQVFDYGERIPVSITIDYGWPFFGSFIPTTPTSSRTSETEIISTYNIREEGFSEGYP